MKRDRPLNDAEVQAILAGRGGQTDDELTELLDRTRKLVEMPEDRTVARHLAAIVAASSGRAGPDAEATATDLEAAPPTRRSLMNRTKPVIAKLALAVSMLTGSTAGLAYAGVDLPGSAAERAFEAVGISLPNQGEPSGEDNRDDKSVSEDVQGVLEGTEERNCEFGQAVAEAASANAQGEQAEPTHDPCDEAESTPEADSTPQGSKATGEAKSAEGKAKAEENKSKGDDAGSEPQGSKDTGESKSEENKSKGDDAGSEPQGSKDTGESKSEENKSNQDDRSEDRPAQGSGQDPEDVPSP